ncbi:MAG TPA: radical SAM protein [Pyrinomonadaceae bacterium]|nr:radical SAM protein [Pyrinomonadaceae bacterium]
MVGDPNPGQGLEMNLVSTVYGPVKSWRLGRSLGVDLLCVNSICSFRCNYCQLGRINVHTAERRIYVPTEKVMADLKASRWRDADVVTFSGSGEPTLAANIRDAIHCVKAFTRKPIVVLTNAANLNDAKVRCDLREADKIFCKLDAADDHTLRMINRPVEGVTIRSIVDGIKALREEYSGYLALQIMLQRLHRKHIEGFALLLNEIRPDEVQLNLPSRPIPLAWCAEARGNNDSYAVPTINAKTLGRDEMARIESELRQLTGLRIVHSYAGDCEVN